MTTTPPPASNARIPWSDLPSRVRAEVERRLGSPVVAARTQPGGFSPGVAARLVLADGGRAFVKAVSPTPNPVAPSIYRREGRIVAAMPPTAPVPRLLFMLDDDPDGWVVLAFEDVEGRQPSLPWRPDELDVVLEAMAALAAELTPSPLRPPLVADAADAFGGVDHLSWASLVKAPDPALDPWSARHLPRLAALEAAASEAARGDTLQHFDVRADNLLLSADGVRIVDRPRLVRAECRDAGRAAAARPRGAIPAGARGRPGRARRGDRRRRRLLHRRFAPPTLARAADVAGVPGRPGRGRAGLARGADRLGVSRVQAMLPA
jgi:Phosphotransferase enzyme family